MWHKTRLIPMMNAGAPLRRRSIGRGCIALGLARLALVTNLTAGQAAGSVPPRPTSDLTLRGEVSRLQLGRAIRGITIGPIENQLHPGRGYGSPACARSMREVKRMGADWVSLTPFGRVLDIHPSGVAMSFEVPFAENRKAVVAAVEQAHAAGLRVLLVPHLWVESGEWRGFIDPGSDADWARWAKSYEGFVTAWASVAQQSNVEHDGGRCRNAALVDNRSRPAVSADLEACARHLFWATDLCSQLG